MARRDVVPVTVLVLLVTAFVLHVTAIATPEWSFFSFSGLYIRQGLFQNCIGQDCVKIENPSAQTKASGAFGIMGAIALLAATTTAFLTLVKEVSGDTTPRIVKIVNALISVAAATLLIICIVTYVTTDTKGTSPEIGFSLKISIAAACSTFLSLVLLIIDIGLGRCR